MSPKSHDDQSSTCTTPFREDGLDVIEDVLISSGNRIAVLIIIGHTYGSGGKSIQTCTSNAAINVIPPHGNLIRVLKQGSI